MPGGCEGVGQRISGLFATHPPLEARLEALSRLESQLQGGGALRAA